MNEPEQVPGHAGQDHCENCHAALRGEFCHHCGQSIHNPVRHAGHALEELFESFWHLDGRVFRTLRDTLVPGRTATEYLAGHRQRYLPPLRLFVVMSLLAFFIGQLTIHLDREPITLRTDTRAILESRTVEEVQRNRDEMLARIEQSRVKAGKVLPVDAALIAAQVQIQGEAANRIKELGGSKPSVADALRQPLAHRAGGPGPGQHRAHGRAAGPDVQGVHELAALGPVPAGAGVRGDAQARVRVQAPALSGAPGGGAVQPRVPADGADHAVPVVLPGRVAAGARQLAVGVRVRGQRGADHLDTAVPAVHPEAGVRPGLADDPGQVHGHRNRLRLPAGAGRGADVAGDPGQGLSRDAAARGGARRLRAATQLAAGADC
ncbi:MAG: DUF3667 domain-containing protein [Lysobacteraceae bacterium]|nr:MAG: DUF3667 domain-containing protein [Xanthomonadaceae bacterium]